MKQDVGLFDVGGSCPDIVIEDGDLKADNSLETPRLISIFSDQLVSREQLPTSENDRRGWWADLVSENANDLIGSTLWLTERGKILKKTASDIENAIRKSFDWLIEDGIAKKVEVTAVVSDSRIVASAKVYKPEGESIPFKFIWDGQALKLVG